MEKYNVIYIDAPDGVDRKKLEALPITGLSEPEALLGLWFPVAELAAYLTLIAGWGFRYGRLLTWSDLTAEQGYWFHHKCEYLLVGVRGKVDRNIFPEHGLYDCKPEEAGCHPEVFRNEAMRMANRAFRKLRLMDVFGAYWKGLYPDYRQEDWDFLREVGQLKSGEYGTGLVDDQF